MLAASWLAAGVVGEGGQLSWLRIRVPQEEAASVLVLFLTRAKPPALVGTWLLGLEMYCRLSGVAVAVPNTINEEPTGC